MVWLALTHDSPLVLLFATVFWFAVSVMLWHLRKRMCRRDLSVISPEIAGIHE
jgi:hypothetical protein